MLFKSLKETYRPEPQITEFELHKTNQRFINQVVQLYTRFLEKIPDTLLPDEICKAYFFDRGEEPIKPGYGYNLGGMQKVMLSLKDDDFLDFIHISLQVINQDRHAYLFGGYDFINDLNDVFRNNGIGYSVRGDRLVPTIDTELHDNMIIPTLTALDSQRGDPAKKEMDNALDNYKEKKYRECIHSSCNAVESRIKQLCVKEKLSLPTKLDLSNLIKHLKNNGYFSKYDEDVQNKIVDSVCHIAGFRNTCGGHGQNPSGGVVDEKLARYVLFLSMTALNFLN